MAKSRKISKQCFQKPQLAISPHSMNTMENILQRVPEQNKSRDYCIKAMQHYLSPDQAAQVIEQFLSDTWVSNKQVLWSGMTGSEAQKWADAHNMQTLTTVMGPLMKPQQPHCDRGKKVWSRYVHGASAIFAWCIAQGQSVIMLSPPPPERFHPSGLSYFQVIEEPIIKGTASHEAPCRILMVHPTVKGAENVCYEIWPHDSSSAWIELFGLQPGGRNWRQTGNETFTSTGQSTVCTPLAAEEKQRKKAKREKKLKKISSKNYQASKAKEKRLEAPKKIAELKREKKACAEKKSTTKTVKPTISKAKKKKKKKKKKKAKSEKIVKGYACPSKKRISALLTGSKSQP